MNDSDDSRQWRRGTSVILVLLLVGLVANLTLVIKLKQEVTSFQQEAPKRPSLPCAALPTRFVMQEPVCAQKLIEAMHVTSIRVRTNESQLGGGDSEMASPLGDVARWRGDAINRSR